MTAAAALPTAPPGRGLELLRAGADALQAEDVAGLPAVALGEQLTALESLIARLRREQARRTVAFEAAGGPLHDGFPTAASWLRANTLASPRDAGDLVAVGRALRDRLPATEAGLSDGSMSFGSATAIVRVLRDVRDPEVLASADVTLAGLAPTLHPSQVAQAARRVLEHLVPDLLQRDAAQRWADRTLSLAPMLDGAVSVSGQLDEVSAAVILSALTPMMTPRGPEDVRTAGQRRVDALVELVGKAAEIGAAGTTTSTGLPPTLLVKVDIARLRDIAATDGGDSVGDGGAGDLGMATLATATAATTTSLVVRLPSALRRRARHRAKSTGAARSSTRPCAGSAAPPRLSAWSRTGPAVYSIWVEPGGSCPPRRIWREWPAMAAACSPAAIVRRSGPMPTMSSHGAAAAGPTWTTCCRSAGSTITCSTRAAGRWRGLRSASRSAGPTAACTG